MLISSQPIIGWLLFLIVIQISKLRLRLMMNRRKPQID